MTSSAISRRSLLWVLTGAVVLIAACVGGCGDDSAASSTTGPQPGSTTSHPPAVSTTSAGETVPTPEELAASLLTAEDLGGAWSAASDILSSGIAPGVVTDEIRQELPKLDMCPEAGAEAAAAASGVEWQAFTLLEMPGETAQRPVILGEFLFAGDPDDIDDIFVILKEASAVCAGIEQASEDGEMEVAELMPIPAVGDGRFGAQVIASDGEIRSYLRAAFVRDGAVFMFLDLWEVTSGDAVLTTDEFDAIVTTAAGKLP